MPFYVGMSYSATRSIKLKSRFKCKACGFKSKMEVLGLGQGSGHAAYFVDMKGASGLAKARAEKAAENDARFLTDLVPCSRCGKRDVEQMSRFWWHSALAVLGIGAIFGALTALFISEEPELSRTSLGLVFPFTGLLIMVIVTLLRLNRLRLAKLRVRFLD